MSIIQAARSAAQTANPFSPAATSQQPSPANIGVLQGINRPFIGPPGAMPQVPAGAPATPPTPAGGPLPGAGRRVGPVIPDFFRPGVAPGGAPPIPNPGKVATLNQREAPGPVLPGWDPTKWADPSHNTPKYQLGRILSRFAPRTENMPAVLAALKVQFPGITQVGKDKVNIPGVGLFDILRSASVGGDQWQMLDQGAPGAPVTPAGGVPQATPLSLPPTAGGGSDQGQLLRAILAQLGVPF